MAPADSLARLRKALMDRAERREAPVTRLCREAGISRSRFYELRARVAERRAAVAAARAELDHLERELANFDHADASPYPGSTEALTG